MIGFIMNYPIIGWFFYYLLKSKETFMLEHEGSCINLVALYLCVE